MEAASDPRRAIQLGADAWAIIATEAAGLQLPSPFRAEDGPVLNAEERDAAVQAMRNSGVLVGDSEELIADLHPALRASLLVQLSPAVVIDSSVGLGADLTAARHALQGDLASGLSRRQRVVDEGVELGPVTWSAMPLEAVAIDVLEPLDVPAERPQAAALELDPAVALAVVRALAEDRVDVARAILGDEDVPPPLRHGTDRLDSIARIDVSGPARTTAIMALRIEGAWWTATIGAGELELRPVGRDELVSVLAEHLAEALSAGAHAA